MPAALEVTHHRAGRLAELARLIHVPAWDADGVCEEHPEVAFPPRGETAEAAVYAACRARRVPRPRPRHPLAEVVWGGTTAADRKAPADRGLARVQGEAMSDDGPPVMGDDGNDAYGPTEMAEGQLESGSTEMSDVDDPDPGPKEMGY